MTNEERQHAIEWFKRRPVMMAGAKRMYDLAVEALEQPEIIHCRDCKHNPKKEWFGCPMAHLNSIQRPEDAWCWRGEREAE